MVAAGFFSYHVRVMETDVWMNKEKDIFNMQHNVLKPARCVCTPWNSWLWLSWVRSSEESIRKKCRNNNEV